MNICLLSQNYPPSKHLGGIGVVVQQLAQGLAAAGHQVHVIARAEGQDPESMHDIDGVTVHRVRPVKLVRGLWRLEERLHPALGFRLRYSVRVNQRLQTLIKLGAVDVVVSPDYNAEAWWFARFGKRVPLVVSLHGPSFTAHQFHGYGRTLRARLEDRMERDLIRRADRIHAVSGNIAEVVSARFSLPRGRMQVIHNAVQFNGHQAEAPEVPERLRVVFAGRLEPRKGVDVLARAIPLVHAVHPDAEFLFIGRDGHATDGGSMAEHLKQLAGGSADRMQFLGQQPHAEVLAQYQRSTLCVFPSRFEPFGTVALEAMACSRPVIATRATGFSEMIEDHVNGVLVPQDDPAALSQAIVELLDDSALRRRLGEAARQMVGQRFTQAQIIPQWIALLESLAASTQRAVEPTR